MTPKKIDTRTETAAVKAYLTALNENHRRGRGRRTVEWLQEKAQSLPAEIESETDPLKRLSLRQALQDVEADLAAAQDTDLLDTLEQQFVKHARSFSERKGITREVWRSEGVPAAVLRSAGL